MLSSDQQQNQSTNADANDRQFQNAPPSLSLPKGGGAIRGMGEKFAANPVTGTGSMTVGAITAHAGSNPALSAKFNDLALSEILRKSFLLPFYLLGFPETAHWVSARGKIASSDGESSLRQSG